jgi:signal transduction histidine kinase
MIHKLFLAIMLAAQAPGAAVDSPVSDSYIPISAIHLLLEKHPDQVTVRATLTRNGSPIYIQDSTEGAAVEAAPNQNLKIGDQVLVTGWPEETDSGLIFRKATIRVLWPGIPIPPLAVTPDQAALGKFPNTLIEVQGRLIGGDEKDGLENSLRVENGYQIFLAHFDSAKESLLLPQLDRGSLLRLRGICSIRPEDTHHLGGFALLLRSAEDIDRISGPPWWSPRHLLQLGVLLIGVIWAAHVARVRMMKAKFQAIMAERARVGNEMHDTLAQSFAGVAFQIQAAKNNAPDEDHVLKRHLDLALDMVRHSHSEAHRSIVMLRPQSLDVTTNLQEALKQSIERMTEGCDISVHFTVSGTQVSLPLFVEDALYRVAQESIANSLRHGNPSNLRIILEYRGRVIHLTVTDDGNGFDISRLDRSGFGVSGMRQRIRSLRGTFSITSTPGEGTTVQAEVPTARFRLAIFKSAFGAYRNHQRKFWRTDGIS